MENKAIIVTVNDYLARRDAEWMRLIYEFLGLKVGIVNSNQQIKEKCMHTILMLFMRQIMN